MSYLKRAALEGLCSGLSDLGRKVRVSTGSESSVKWSGSTLQVTCPPSLDTDAVLKNGIASEMGCDYPAKPVPEKGGMSETVFNLARNAVSTSKIHGDGWRGLVDSEVLGCRNELYNTQGLDDTTAKMLAISHAIDRQNGLVGEAAPEIQQWSDKLQSLGVPKNSANDVDAWTQRALKLFDQEQPPQPSDGDGDEGEGEQGDQQQEGQGNGQGDGQGDGQSDSQGDDQGQEQGQGEGDSGSDGDSGGDDSGKDQRMDTSGMSDQAQELANQMAGYCEEDAPPSGNKGAQFDRYSDENRIRVADEFYRGACYHGRDQTCGDPTQVATTVAQQVRRYIQVDTRARKRYNQTAGKIHRRALYKVAMPTVGDGSWNRQVFSQKVPKKELDTAISILVDSSGSMAGKKAKVAAQAAMLLQEVFCSALRMDNVQVALFDEYGRTNQVTVVKPRNKIVPELHKVAYSNMYGHHMHCNDDFRAVKWAWSDIMKQRNKRKIIMVLSDGSPAAIGTPNCEQALYDIVKEIEGSNTVEIMSIGICDNSPQHYYENNQIVNVADDLPDAVLNCVRDLILKN